MIGTIEQNVIDGPGQRRIGLIAGIAIRIVGLPPSEESVWRPALTGDDGVGQFRPDEVLIRQVFLQNDPRGACSIDGVWLFCRI